MDRIIAEDQRVITRQDGEVDCYTVFLVKWRNLGYDECTWENEEVTSSALWHFVSYVRSKDLNDDDAVLAFEKRQVEPTAKELHDSRTAQPHPSEWFKQGTSLLWNSVVFARKSYASFYRRVSYL